MLRTVGKHTQCKSGAVNTVKRTDQRPAPTATLPRVEGQVRRSTAYNQDHGRGGHM